MSNESSFAFVGLIDRRIAHIFRIDRISILSICEMGVNNLTRFLHSSKIFVEKMNDRALVRDEGYELFVDLAIIVVPLLQKSTSVDHFGDLLRDTFRNPSSSLVRLMLRAKRVYVFLDMLSPRMKTETRQKRCLKNLLEIEVSSPSATFVRPARPSSFEESSEAEKRFDSDDACQSFATKLYLETKFDRARLANTDDRTSAAVNGECVDSSYRAMYREKYLWPVPSIDRSLVDWRRRDGDDGGYETTLPPVENRAESVSTCVAPKFRSDDVDIAKRDVDQHRSRVVDFPLTSMNGSKEYWSAENANRELDLPSIKLKDVRFMVADVILNSFNVMDETFASRCTIETEEIGEGEIKCIRGTLVEDDPFKLSVEKSNANVRKRSILDDSNAVRQRSNASSLCSTRGSPVVILSNDNDVILMMLMHHKSSNGGGGSRTTSETLFYRAMFYDKSKSSISHCVELQRVSFGSNCLLKNVVNKWIVLLWFVCCCGTDFVSHVRPFSIGRRIKIFDRCLIRGLARTALWLRSEDTKFCLRNFLSEVRWFVRLVVESCTDRSIAIREHADVVANDLHRCSSNFEQSATAKDRCLNRTRVVNWLVRLYWNILYLIDLPLDFYNKPNFRTDETVSVNCYVPEEYVSVFALQTYVDDEKSVDDLEKLLRLHLKSLRSNVFENRRVERFVREQRKTSREEDRSIL